MAKIIYARSPFIVTIDALTLNNTTVELRFRRFSDPTYSTNADYTLSKNIPAVNQTETKYNISPYIREYINLTTPTLDWTDWSTVATSPIDEDDYIMVQVTTYRGGLGVSNTEYFAFDGWGYYEDGINPDYRVGTGVDEGTVMMLQGTYYYLLDCANPTTTPLTNFDYRANYISIVPGENWYVEHTNLSTNVTTALNLAAFTDEAYLFKSVIFTNAYDDGYKVEIFDNNNFTRWLGYFKPLAEQKYTPLVCDFINKFGAWQRTWFYKASRQSMEVTQEEYKGLDGLFKPFNTNGKESVTVNTGWVDEEYNETVLKQLMFSEKILLDGKPVKVKSKTVNLQKHINDRTINYAMEFDYSYDMLNTISL